MHICFKHMAVATGLAIVPMPAFASSVNTTMPVTATTLATCAVVAQPLVFGTLNQIGGAATDSQTTVVVTCTPGVAYDVGLDQGAHSDANGRHMLSALTTSTIPYLLYSNASRTTAWGNTVGTNTVTGTATAIPATLTVYGRVPANAPIVAAGAYTDTVTVTVFF